jgi:hypothetical protein
MRQLLILALTCGSAFAQTPVEKEISLGRRLVLEIETHQKMIDNAEALCFYRKPADEARRPGVPATDARA